MTSSRQMHLGCFMFGTGAFIPGWRIPDAADNNERLSSLQAIAAQAERAKFDMIFLADNLASLPGYHPSEVAKLEPFSLLSALSVTTKHIGLAGTLNVNFSEPYNAARTLATLDHLSDGRAAWNVVTAAIPEYIDNYGRPGPTDGGFSHDERYAIADEYISVVKKLWDSWSDDAFVRDRRSGVFFDATKVASINHTGTYFSVKGPLNVSRPPQGHPVTIQAGSSPAGQDCAAKHAEIVFTVQQDLTEAKIFYAGLKSRVAAAGRDPEHCKVMPGLFPVIGETHEEAHAKLERLMSYVDPQVALGTISTRFAHDVSRYPLDGPLPQLPKPTTYSQVMLAKAEREGLTWRQLYNIMAIGRGYIVAVGSATEVADFMELWFRERACDGFIVTPSHFPGGFEDFVQLLTPELQQRGLFRREYQGSTLREHLGLPKPISPQRI